MEEVNNLNKQSNSKQVTKRPEQNSLISHVIHLIMSSSMVPHRFSIFVFVGSVVLGILSILLIRPDILPTGVVSQLLGKKSIEPSTVTALFHGHFSGPVYRSRDTRRIAPPNTGFLSWFEAIDEGRKQAEVAPATTVPDTLVYPVQIKPFNTDISVETQSSLNLARNMTVQNKTEKARKILLHALSLHPHHPDVLNEYGEFLERTGKDIVLAEHMYCRALFSSPSHTQALTNRKRTLPLVEEIDQSRFDTIDRKRDMLVRVPENHPGLRRMVKESYFRHLYHTTAMEGNTFTLSQTRSFVETHIVIAGKSVMEHNEILGMEAALNFLNSSLIKRIGAITVKDIIDIHHRVLGYVDPIGAGLLRTTQVFVGDFTPPHASQVEPLMAEFVEWLNSEEALTLHPIEMGALAHYKLVYIHPFYDGNGRTSRLLMNLVLMQTGYPPIIIPVEEKQTYYKNLQTANNGDVRPFIRFIAQCAERTIEEFLWASVENISRTFPEISPAGSRRLRGDGVGGWDDEGATIRLDGEEETDT